MATTLIRRSISSAGVGSRSIPISPSSASSSSRSSSMMHSRNGSGNSIASSASRSERSFPPLEGDDGRKGTMASSSSSSLHILRAFLRRQFAEVSSGLASLSDSPPELRKAYILKFLDSYAYFSFSLVFTIFLSDDFGMGDVRAGSIYGAYGALVTVYGLFTGTVIDNLGVATCLKIGFVLTFFSRCAIFATDSRGVLLFNLLVALPLGNCLGIPVLTVGIRRYTNEVNRGFAFGMFYCVMNVGALVAGPLVDAFTLHYNNEEKEEGAVVDDGTNGDVGTEIAEDDGATSSWKMTANRAIILSGVVANFVAIVVAFGMREIKVDANAERTPRNAVADDGGNSNDGAAKVTRFRPLKGSSYQILSETVREPTFQRFLLVCLLTLNVRMVFRHLDGTLPKYMVREFGENTPKGRVYSINPAMIIVLVPIISAATSAVDPLVMIHHGTYVSAASVFFLALSTSVPACVLFVIALSIGEAMWSPRLYDYTTSVAPEGREGTYMALSSAPLFLAKLPVGFLSGLLLQRYCPEHLEEGEVRHSRTMWTIIGLSTIVSPILITVLWSYISGGNERGGGMGVDMGMDNEEGLIGDGEGGMEDDSSEHSYQHHPLVTNISLPRVPRGERPVG